MHYFRTASMQECGKDGADTGKGLILMPAPSRKRVPKSSTPSAALCRSRHGISIRSVSPGSIPCWESKVVTWLR